MAEFQVGGVSGSGNGYPQSGKAQGRKEQDVSDINLFAYGNDNEKSSMQRKLENRKEISDDVNKNSENRMKKIKALLKKGYSMSKAIQMVDDTPKNRKEAVEKLKQTGLPEEVVEKNVPDDFDEQVELSRTQGENEVKHEYSKYKDPVTGENMGWSKEEREAIKKEAKEQ